MEPENRALEVRKRLKGRLPLCWRWWGRALRLQYIRRVRDTNDLEDRHPGAIYGQGYRELGSHCFAYIHATEVGGTHPALIEAMGRGALVLYRNTPENAEVAEGAASPSSRTTCVPVSMAALAMPESERQELRRRAAARVRERYSWEAVASEYESLFRRLRQ
jgi:hypothetical protein